MNKLLMVLLLLAFNSEASIRIHGSELNCLAQNAYFEANLEGDVGMLLVTNVVFNRTHGGKFCNTIWSPKQFSWTSGKKKKIPVNILNDIKSNINNFSLHRHLIPKKFIVATHYHAKSEYPIWAHKLKRIGAYKNHVFYKV